MSIVIIKIEWEKIDASTSQKRDILLGECEIEFMKDGEIMTWKGYLDSEVMGFFDGLTDLKNFLEGKLK